VTKVNSISFWEDSLIWTEVSRDDTTIEVIKAVWESLPLFINHKTIQQKISTSKLTSFLKEIIKKHNLKTEKVRITLPGRFTIIKKINIEGSIPETNYHDLVLYEFEKIWEESNKNYNIYLPNSEQGGNAEKELLALAVRKNLYNFLIDLFSKAEIELELISLSCFTIDELFRAIFPNSSGQILLLGWQRQGFDTIITDNKSFISYYFRPYNANLDQINMVNEFELANAFSNLLYSLQHPSILEQPIYDIQTVYNYGYYFKPEWLEFMRSRVQIPINLFNFDASTAYKLSVVDQQVSPEHIYRYIEPISNVL
jgi:hypothetical protein